MRHSPALGESPQARLAAVWPEVVGDAVAKNAHPQSLRQGRLTVATRTSVWAQTLQFMGDDVLQRLNEGLGEELVKEIRFRPAGWDPGGGAGGPHHLGVEGVGGASGESGGEAAPAQPEKRPLTAEEEGEVEAVRRAAVDSELGEKIAAAMRAALQRQPGKG